VGEEDKDKDDWFGMVETREEVVRDVSWTDLEKQGPAHEHGIKALTKY
jgi:hypothetical protein